MALFATRRTLASTIYRALSSSPSSSSSRFRYALPLFLNPQYSNPSEQFVPTRPKTSGSGYSPLNDPSPNWSNRPPKETILLDGCDYEHWLIVMEFPDPKPSEEEMINAYVKTIAAVVGSEEEAKKKIYSVCTTTYTGFGVLISEELSYKVKVEQMGTGLGLLGDQGCFGQTKAMGKTEKSSIGHNIDLIKAKVLDPGLDLDMTDAGRPCRLKKENRYKEEHGHLISNFLHNQCQSKARISPTELEEVRQDLRGTVVEDPMLIVML
ncbi:hypothetical protein RND71_001931 [Anisodus tanguticus]|uniref:MORF/ORRM1/DAG-like MORF domain-containing protein n=1 Tax=Anisodus tanguticus TaxID=243964 RepID=A0AAE1T066_9SOLA|nr:hypothetical protein RND71_001931 [Anisodus tanguticus]